MENEPSHPVFETLDLSPLPTWGNDLISLQKYLKKTSFVSGNPGSLANRMAFFTNQEKSQLFTRVWFGPASEGPPGHVHGGCLSAVLDECLAATGALAGFYLLTGELKIKFLRKVPLGFNGEVLSQVTDENSRFLTTKGTIRQGDRIFCEGEALLVKRGKKEFV